MLFGINLSRNEDHMSHHNHQRKIHETSSPVAVAKPAPSVASTSRIQPAADHIRLRAYEISQARNGGPGDALADWIQAEQETTTARDAAL
jgi:hypothetical protein